MYRNRRLLAATIAGILLAFVIGSGSDASASASGYLGVTATEVTEEKRSAWDLDTNGGIYVTYVEEGSPAHSGGVVRGDIIVRIAGFPVATTEQLRHIIALQPPGDTVELLLLRDSELMPLNVVAGTRSLELDWVFFAEARGTGFVYELEPTIAVLDLSTDIGFQPVTLSPSLASYFECETGAGVLVTELREKTALRNGRKETVSWSGRTHEGASATRGIRFRVAAPYLEWQESGDAKWRRGPRVGIEMEALRRIVKSFSDDLSEYRLTVEGAPIDLIASRGTWTEYSCPRHAPASFASGHIRSS